MPCAAHFRFTSPSTTEIYTLSLHDALPIFEDCHEVAAFLERVLVLSDPLRRTRAADVQPDDPEPPLVAKARSEEHTSELQSRRDLVCRLLLEKKKACRRSKRPPPTTSPSSR